MYVFKFLPDFTIVIAIIVSRYYTVLTKSQILFSPRVLRKESAQTRVYVLLKTPRVQDKIIENSRCSSKSRLNGDTKRRVPFTLFVYTRIVR